MADKKKKSKVVPPDVSHKPTDELRKKVQSYAAVGITQADICAVIGITDKTLRKYYSHELDTAAATANAQIGGKLFKAAMEGCPTRQMFWLKTRAKWSEKTEVELTGKDGGVIETKNVMVDKTAEELAKTYAETLRELHLQSK